MSINRPDKPQHGHLPQPLPYSVKEQPRSSRSDYAVGCAPAELLRNLVTQSLAALRIVRSEVNVDESPVVLGYQLTAESIDIVIASLYCYQCRIINRGADHLALLYIGRGEHITLEM